MDTTSSNHRTSHAVLDSRTLDTRTRQAEAPRTKMPISYFPRLHASPPARTLPTVDDNSRSPDRCLAFTPMRAEQATMAMTTKEGNGAKKGHTREHQCSIWVRRLFPYHTNPFPSYASIAQVNHTLLSQSTRMHASFYVNKRDRSTRGAVLLRRDAVSWELEGTPVLQPACFLEFTPRLDHSVGAFDLGHRNDQTCTVKKDADRLRASFRIAIWPLIFSNRGRPRRSFNIGRIIGRIPELLHPRFTVLDEGANSWNCDDRSRDSPVRRRADDRGSR